MAGKTASPTAALAAAVLSPITIDTRREALMVLRRDDDIDITSATPTNAKANTNTNALVILPLTPHPYAVLSPSREEPDTPSSTHVEFGDFGKNEPQQPSAAELAENVYRAYSQSLKAKTDTSEDTEQVTQEEVQRDSRPDAKPEPKPESKPESESQSRSQSRQRDRRNGHSHPVTPIVGPRGRSQSATRWPSNNIKDTLQDNRLNGQDKMALMQEREMANNKVNRFLHQMSQQDPQSAEQELLLENRSLYQRISTLQRIEREMLAENQDLMRQYAALRQHHDLRRRQWRDDYRLREKAFATRIQQLKEQIADQETQMLEMARTHTKKIAPLLSDKDIVSWFTAKDTAWHSWAQENAFRDSSRLSSKLHPLQLVELCHGVESFVRLTDDGELPEEVLAGGTEMVPTLLHGMLVNFICNEILASPFWVFSAMSMGNLESPSIPEPTSNSPVGFRMDLALFRDIAPLRSAPLRSAACAHTPGSPLFPPPIITSMIPPLGINTTTMGLPMKPEMENMYTMLLKAQKDDSNVTAHQWRAQTMRLFAESGIAAKNTNDRSLNETGRLLVEARQNYARKLRERFLGGAARYLLKDQDARGIERLERHLTQEIDDALRFSSQIWSRPTPLRLQGWNELGHKEFSSTSDIMELCHAQAPPQSEEALLNPETPPPGYYDGRSVLMVVQPTIEALAVNQDDEDDLSPENGQRTWLKARVVVSVTGPSSADAAPAPDYEKVEGTNSRSVSQQQQNNKMNTTANNNNNATLSRPQAGPLPPKSYALKVIPGPTSTSSPISTKNPWNSHKRSQSVSNTNKASVSVMTGPSPAEKAAMDEKPVKAMEVLASQAFNPFPGDLPKISLTSASPNSATTTQAPKVTT